jgi:hypothetical protein
VRTECNAKPGRPQWMHFLVRHRLAVAPSAGYGTRAVHWSVPNFSAIRAVARVASASVTALSVSP